MTNQEYSQLEKIRGQFKNLENSLFDIKRKLLQKDGFWFVKWHVYEQEQLLNDAAFARIDAFVGVISSNIESWLGYNSISQEFMLHYNAMRDNLELKIENLKNDIIDREPTFWETISDGFKGFFKFLISKLPKIVVKYLTGGKSTLLIDN
jgi:hypothetical protein